MDISDLSKNKEHTEKFTETQRCSVVLWHRVGVLGIDLGIGTLEEIPGGEGSPEKLETDKSRRKEVES